MLVIPDSVRSGPASDQHHLRRVGPTGPSRTRGHAGRCGRDGLAGFANPYGAFSPFDNGVFSIVGPEGVLEGDVTGTAGTFSCTEGGNDLWRPVLSTDGPGDGCEWPC